MNETTTTTTTGLTYAERKLSDGGMNDGMIAGLSLDRAEIRAARAAYASFRRVHGYRGAADMLTRPDAQPKLGKSERYALGLMLTPARTMAVEVLRVTDVTARPVNACPRASAGCAAACLSTAGHGAFSATQRARQVRHAFVLQHPHAAGVIIGAEIRRAVDKYGPDGVTFRFNVLTDYRIEFIMPGALAMLQELGVRVYDYTAWAPESRTPVFGYSLTYSAKESAHTSDAYLTRILTAGHNVAMPMNVGKGAPLPERFAMFGMSWPVIDGDLTDDRTTDPRGRRGVIVGLRPKGAAGKRDASGFIRTV
jgi:hypothetical protein